MSSLEMLLWVLGMWLVVRPLGNHLARRADARAHLTDAEAERLNMAFQRLGAVRVRRGLRSQGHAWKDCFLAFATGGRPFGLRPGHSRGWRTEPFIGLNEDATKALVRIWDRKETAFRSFADTWLETHETLTAPSAEPHADPAHIAPKPLEVMHA